MRYINPHLIDWLIDWLNRDKNMKCSAHVTKVPYINSAYSSVVITDLQYRRLETDVRHVIIIRYISFRECPWAPIKSLQMVSLRWYWRCCLDALLQQARPWRSRASTVLPHAHLWGWHALQPSLWLWLPHRRVADLLMWQVLQSPECGDDDAAICLALSMSVMACEHGFIVSK